jgi:hypothetical protein
MKRSRQPPPVRLASSEVSRERWRAAFLGLAASASGLASVSVARRAYGAPAVTLWALAVGVLFVAVARDWKADLTRSFRPGRACLVALLALVPCALRLALAAPHRVHIDELVTGYFATHEDLSAGMFFGLVPQRGDWAGQFATVFWVIQKRLLALFGDDLFGLRLSVQPYVFLCALLVYAIAARLFDRRTGVFAVLLYTAFSMSLYLETMGISFVSSGAVLAIALFFMLRMTAPQALPADAVAAGVFTAASYLFYYSSFVALAVLAFAVLAHALRDRKAAARQGALALLAFAVVLAPFAAWAVRSPTFLDRFQRIFVFGSAAPVRRGASLGALVTESLGRAIASLYTRGIGGKGGYFLGQVAFFDAFTGVLFLCGLITALAFLKRARGTGVVLFTIGISFVTGVVLTAPGPAFHRLSGAFPLLAIVLALPFFALFRWRLPTVAVKWSLAAGVLALFASANAIHFTSATDIEYGSVEELRLANYVNARFPDRDVLVAAHGGAGYEKAAYFAEPRHTRRVRSSLPADFINRFRRFRRYVYVVLFDERWRRDFEALDPEGRFYRFSSGYAVFYNDRDTRLVLPEALALPPLRAAARSSAPGLALAVSNAGDSEPAALRATPVLGFPCDEGPYENERVALRYDGCLRAADGAYVLRIRADDEARVSLNGVTVLALAAPGGTASVPLSLADGDYAFQLDYRNNAGYACLRVEWSEDGGETFGPMPASWLRH